MYDYNVRVVVVCIFLLLLSIESSAEEPKMMDLLYQRILAGDSKEVDTLLSQVKFDNEKEESVKQILYQYSYLQSQLDLSLVFDKHFNSPNFVENSELLFNKLCVNEFYQDLTDKIFINWLWSEKVEAGLIDEKSREQFLNECAEVATDKGNYEAVKWSVTKLQNNNKKQ